MADSQRVITTAAFNQLDSSMQMLKTLVDVCVDEVWCTVYHGIPFWYHVYHVAYFIDYWLREDFGNDSLLSMEFDKRIPPEFEHPVDPSILIERTDMQEHIRILFVKVNCYFAYLDDDRLSEPVINGRKDLTYADVIMTQIRHIMYNIGYLNGILRGIGLTESDWYAYNEIEDSD